METPDPDLGAYIAELLRLPIPESPAGCSDLPRDVWGIISGLCAGYEPALRLVCRSWRGHFHDWRPERPWSCVLAHLGDLRLLRGLLGAPDEIVSVEPRSRDGRIDDECVAAEPRSRDGRVDDEFVAAATGGQTAVLVHLNGNYEVSYRAFHSALGEAALAGHFQAANYLSGAFPPPLESRRHEASGGHLLRDKYLPQAVGEGKSEVVKFFLDWDSSSWSPRAVEIAAGRGRVDLLELLFAVASDEDSWLLDKDETFTEDDIESWIGAAVRNDRGAVVEFLCDQFGQRAYVLLAVAAADAGNIRIMRKAYDLMKATSPCATEDIEKALEDSLVSAAFVGQLEAMRTAKELGAEGYRAAIETLERALVHKGPSAPSCQRMLPALELLRGWEREEAN